MNNYLRCLHCNRMYNIIATEKQYQIRENFKLIIPF